MSETTNDRRTQAKKLGNWSLGAAGTAGVLAAALVTFEDTKWYGTFIFMVSGFLVLAGGIAHAVAYLFPKSEPASRFATRLMTEQEINRVRAFVEKHVSADLLSADEMRAMLRRNPELVWVVEAKPRDASENSELVGCFSIFPLKQGAVTLLEQGDHKAALIEGLITAKKGAPRGFYIGAVVGSTVRAQGHVVREVKSLIATKCKRKSVSKLFGRPITPDGVRMLKKNGFRCAIGNEPPKINFVCAATWSPN